MDFQSPQASARWHKIHSPLRRAGSVVASGSSVSVTRDVEVCGSVASGKPGTQAVHDDFDDFGGGYLVMILMILMISMILVVVGILP